MDVSQHTNFVDAANELDELSLEGFFGEETRKLVEQRDLIYQTDYFVKILDDWISDNKQYGKPNVKSFMMLFLKLYLDAVQTNPAETIDILTEYWRGTKDNPELEGISGYMEAARFIQEAKLILAAFQNKQELKMSEQKKVMAAFITAYSKSIECIGQILVPCIRLVKLVNGEQVDAISIMRLTLYNKVDMFNKESGDKYKSLTDVLNRDIRNADSHLNIRYVPNKQVIQYKKRMGAKIVTYDVTVNDWFLNIYPQVGWFIQAFIFSGTLMCIGFSDKSKFIGKYTQIFNE
ncbi:hypothetical protein QJQ58_15610 [Paenibacillus dendritiformis]|uniref:hypothetical protein n=1 Tax=Paenibacillus dendritiformis TaxID=130049 RepID=UPI00248CDFAB|nr:hypothetical protein [Paenibacillus dendritiformis]WGU92038.1 hypothetical protein QJQ58_15610 [Paenibacillus dendritiformis]